MMHSIAAVSIVLAAISQVTLAAPLTHQTRQVGVAQRGTDTTFSNILGKIEGLVERKFSTEVAGSAVEGASGAAVDNVFKEVESLVRRKLSTEVAGSAVEGASGAAVDNIFKEVESLVRRKISTEVAGSAVEGASGAAVDNIFKEVESFIQRDMVLPRGTTLTPKQRLGLAVAMKKMSQGGKRSLNELD
ncbi:hypothetical protein K439DRAFT_1106674 [Ramaria rubella]|nr:hypothetical protein K439DRAFT_1106674 [Ramaria rubella]